MNILFSNPPWWEQTHGQPLRKGIRSGSRWPFTSLAPHAPDDFRFGSYLPAPFFLQYATSYTARAFPDASVTLRDSIGRGESYRSYFEAIERMKPDYIVIETASPSWDHDARVISVLGGRVPSSRVILFGPIDSAKIPVIMAAHQNVIAIVQGEPDKQITKAIKLHEGLQYPSATRAAGPIPHDLLTVDEMNAAPLPAWDEDCAFNYWDGCPVGHRPPQLQVWTSRGARSNAASVSGRRR